MGFKLPTGNTPGIKDIVEICQGFLNILRDSLIFLMLIINPKIINKILTTAGFVEGEIAGFKWKKQLKKTDSQLIKATKEINSLKQRLEESNQTISEQKKDIKIKKQINKNQEAVREANSINSVIQTTLQANAPLLNSRVNTEDTELTSLIDIVNKYKIQIFHNGSESEQKIAAEIKDALGKEGVKSTIQVLRQRDQASSDQIRYFDQNERNVASDFSR